MGRGAGRHWRTLAPLGAGALRLASKRALAQGHSPWARQNDEAGVGFGKHESSGLPRASSPASVSSRSRVEWRKRLGVEPSPPAERGATGFEDREGHRAPFASALILHRDIAGVGSARVSSEGRSNALGSRDQPRHDIVGV